MRGWNKVKGKREKVLGRRDVGGAEEMPPATLACDYPDIAPSRPEWVTGSCDPQELQRGEAGAM